MLSTKDKEELYGFDPSSRINIDLVNGESSTSQAQKVYDALKNDVFMIKLKQLAWKEFCKNSQHEAGDVTRQVKTLLDESGIRDVISSVTVKTLERNKILHEKCSNILNDLPSIARNSEHEKVDCVRKARISWEQGINEELLAIAQESKRPFLIIRDPGEVNPFMDVRLLPGPVEGVKFLFDSEDLLETGIAIQNPNMNPILHDHYMGLLKLNLPIMDLERAIEVFNELNCTEGQIGVDDSNNSIYTTKFLISRHEEGEAVITQGSMIDARNYCKYGVLPNQRTRIWRRACGLHEETLVQEEREFLQLRVDCDRLDLLTDELFMHDIQTVLDDPRYFIFDEELKDIVLSFSRDSTVHQQCHYQIHAPLYNKLTPTFSSTTTMPPCSIQPFLGFATYFAPLCYVIKHRPSLYTVSRILFCQLWCRLNVLSSDANTLLSVCKTFECLLIQLQPRLFMHLVNIGVQPLKIAFPWIQLGFVGLLEIDQLLLLWDRVIGFMDLNILAVAAAAIFVVRTEPLMKCTSEHEATLVLAEASRLRIIALMQLLLFKDTRLS